jgi:uncharacterized protein (DUF111 family)
MRYEQIGYGAGSRDLPIPNVLRIFIGESTKTPKKNDPHGHKHTHLHTAETLTREHDGEHPHVHHDVTPKGEESHLEDKPFPHQHSPSCLDTDHLSVLETNIDDLNPEFYEHVMDRLFAAGALDVFLAPIQMKKNRPATLLRVLCQPAHVKLMTDILFQETSTLGIREHSVDRHALPRSIHTLQTKYGAVQVKVASFEDGTVKSAPEYEDCRKLAEQHSVAIRIVYQAAQQQAKSEFGG